MSLFFIVSIVGIFFSLENVQGGLISFLHLVNFILYYISQRSRISFPLTHPYFPSFFSSLSFQSNPPTQKKLLQWKFLRKFYYQKRKNPLLEIATKEFHPITHSFLGTSLTSVLNQPSIGILHCA